MCVYIYTHRIPGFLTPRHCVRRCECLLKTHIASVQSVENQKAVGSLSTSIAPASHCALRPLSGGILGASRGFVWEEPQYGDRHIGERSWGTSHCCALMEEKHLYFLRGSSGKQ